MKPANINRKAAWALGAALLLGALAANVLAPVAVRDPSFQLEQVIPAAFGEWKVDPTTAPIPPSPDVQASLNEIYDQIVTRTYVNAKGERVMLVVAYGGEQSDSLKAHRQEVCYTSQGFSVGAVRNDVVHLDGADVPVVRMHAVKGRRSEPVSYWFTMGDKVLMGRFERLVAQIGYGLQGRVPDGVLVRVSSLSRDLGGSYASHDEFLRALMAQTSPSARQRLAGLGPRTS